MFRPLFDALRRYRADERGNFFVLFGASALPLLLVMGGAVDMTRYTRYKAQLSFAVDSASLALSRKHRDYTETQAQEFVTKHVASLLVKGSSIPTSAPFNVDSKFTVENFTVTKGDNGFTVDVEAAMQTIFLPLGSLAQIGSGVMQMPLTIGAEVVHQTNRLEIALVLDNTGSMNCANTVSTCALNWSSPSSDSRIVALKAAASSLVNYLMKDDMEDPDQVKIALVPFETTVNVSAAATGTNLGLSANWPSWIDKGTGQTGTLAKWNGRNLEGWNFSTNARCTNPGTGNCKVVGHRFLFDKLYANDNSVRWAGCVEMRAGSYELSDAAPNTSIPDSLYVPYFAPDEPDSSDTVGSSGATRYNNDSNGSSRGGTQYSYSNDYLRDGAANLPAAAQKYMTKYHSSITWHSGRKDVADTGAANTPYEYGPNRGCPRPIVPLTNADGRAALNTAISKMIAYWNAGTFIPAGLLWGWHVLSPEEPFTEGISSDDEDYENTVKAIVLLTDGDNQIEPGGSTTHNGSNYTSYSYVNTMIGTERRLSSTSTTSESTLDSKLNTLCESVKTTGGIRVYTITFGPALAGATKTMMTNCATLDKGERLYYHAPTSADLADIFGKIGEDLSNIHLAM